MEIKRHIVTVKTLTTCPRLPQLFLPGRWDNFFMVEIVDHHGWLAMLRAYGVIVADVGKPLCLAEGSHLHIELHPVGAVFAGIDVVVELVQFGVVFVNPGENLSLVVAPQVQVLEPH